MARRMIVFDMDGVLAEVTESYREAIVQTVRHFTGQTIERALIQDYKNQGGWNNDWALSHKICEDLGVKAGYAAIVDHFNAIFLGDNANGLILREQWIPAPGLLDRLSQRYQLAIFTGRLQAEAAPTLRRFANGIRFAPIIAADDVTEGKPHPEGLRKIQAAHPDTALWYVGDTVDDARSARAAGVPFVGIAAPGNPRHASVVQLLKAENAIAVLDNVNQLEGVLPQ